MVDTGSTISVVHPGMLPGTEEPRLQGRPATKLRIAIITNSTGACHTVTAKSGAHLIDTGHSREASVGQRWVEESKIRLPEVIPNSKMSVLIG